MKNLFLFLIILTAGSIHAQPSIQWQKAYGGTGAEIAADVKKTSDGGYILIGQTASSDGDVSRNQGGGDVWVVKLTATGAMSWQKTYGGDLADAGKSIEQTTDGGYILAASVQSVDGDITDPHGNGDIWVVKLTATGSMSWEKIYGGSSPESASAIHQTTDGGYILVGTTSSIDSGITNHGNSDIWVVKLTATGAVSWQKTYGGTKADYSSAIEQTSDGGYIVGGYTLSNDGDITANYGSDDEWVFKLTSTGVMSWQKTYGGSKIDVLNAMHQTSDGGYISVGTTYSNDHDVTGKHDSTDMWIVKMTSTGAVVWEKSLGGTLADQGYAVTETASDNFVAAGYTNSTNGDVTGLHGSTYDMWLTGLDKTGNLQWQKTIGSTNNDLATSIIQTNDGGYLALGEAFGADGDATNSGFHGGSDLWAIKLGPNVEVSMAAHADEAIKVYPSPTNGTVSVILPSGFEDATLNLVNISGQEIPFKCDGKGLSRTVQLSGIAGGVYLLEVINKKAISTYRIIYQP